MNARWAYFVFVSNVCIFCYYLLHAIWVAVKDIFGFYSLQEALRSPAA